jgi:hypothetical protein
MMKILQADAAAGRASLLREIRHSSSKYRDASAALSTFNIGTEAAARQPAHRDIRDRSGN